MGNSVWTVALPHLELCSVPCHTQAALMGLGSTLLEGAAAVDSALIGEEDGRVS